MEYYTYIASIVSENLHIIHLTEPWISCLPTNYSPQTAYRIYRNSGNDAYRFHSDFLALRLELPVPVHLECDKTSGSSLPLSSRLRSVVLEDSETLT